VKEGKNTQIVATSPPRGPLNKYPIKVAVMTMGPGVTCPRTMPFKRKHGLKTEGLTLSFYPSKRMNPH